MIPPAPLAMPETAVGHGTLGSYECLPASKHAIRANQLDGLRCGSLLREPGGLKEPVVHVWTHRRPRGRAALARARCAATATASCSAATSRRSGCRRIRPAMWTCTTYHRRRPARRRPQVRGADRRGPLEVRRRAAAPPAPPRDAGVAAAARWSDSEREVAGRTRTSRRARGRRSRASRRRRGTCAACSRGRRG